MSFRDMPRRRSDPDPAALAFGQAVRGHRRAQKRTLEDVAAQIPAVSRNKDGKGQATVMDPKYLGELEAGWFSPSITTAKLIAARCESPSLISCATCDATATPLALAISERRMRSAFRWRYDRSGAVTNSLPRAAAGGHGSRTLAAIRMVRCFECACRGGRARARSRRARCDAVSCVGCRFDGGSRRNEKIEANMAAAHWNNIPIRKTPKGVKIALDGIYYYPHAGDPAQRGHGYISVNKEQFPFEDEIELLEALSSILRRAKQVAARP